MGGTDAAGLGRRGGERALVAARVRALLAAPLDRPVEPNAPEARWLPESDLRLSSGPASGEIVTSAEVSAVPSADLEGPSQSVLPLSVLSGGAFRGGRGRHHQTRPPAVERRPAGRIRLDAGRRGGVMLGLVVLLVAVVTAWWVFLGRPHASAVPVITTALGSGSGSASAGPTRSSSVPTAVVVNVVGRVKRPGVYQLRAGSRVEDAVRAAGGASPGADLTSTNLARRVVDGEQISVGVASAGAPTAASDSSTPTGSGGLVDLNTATAEQLDALPGVGPVLAQHILEWRAAHGRFDSADQLGEVSGIGPSKYAELRPLVTA